MTDLRNKYIFLTFIEVRTHRDSCKVIDTRGASQRLNVELLVHSEVNANELGFSGLLPNIFYKGVKWFKTFYDKIKALIESKDSKIHFCNKFIICRLNMYLKYYSSISEIKLFMLNTKFCNKNGLLPFN